MPKVKKAPKKKAKRKSVFERIAGSINKRRAAIEKAGGKGTSVTFKSPSKTKLKKAIKPRKTTRRKKR